MRLLTIGALALLGTVAAAKGRAYLGVSVGPLDEEHRKHFSIPEEIEAGVVLTEVRPGSAAEAAGFKPGDVVAFFDGKPVKTMEELVAAVTAHEPGDMVTYVLRRGSGKIEGTLRLGERAEEVVIEPPPPPRPDLEGRLDRLQEEIGRLQRRLREVRERWLGAKRRGLEAWLEREERGLAEARERGDKKRMVFHEARLALLREMRAAGVRFVAPPAQRGLEERVRRLEELVEEILHRLDRE